MRECDSRFVGNWAFIELLRVTGRMKIWDTYNNYITDGKNQSETRNRVYVASSSLGSELGTVTVHLVRPEDDSRWWAITAEIGREMFRLFYTPGFHPYEPVAHHFLGAFPCDLEHEMGPIGEDEDYIRSIVEPCPELCKCFPGNCPNVDIVDDMLYPGSPGEAGEVWRMQHCLVCDEFRLKCHPLQPQWDEETELAERETAEQNAHEIEGREAFKHDYPRIPR